ncbi:MAG: hypothetical protein Q9227_000096 [Pyrenula ochraceoflavens]
MAKLALDSLPTEILDMIIPDTLPEGFESLALTCKTVYGLCLPFIEHHKHFKSEFETFKYGKTRKDPSSPFIKTAFDLIGHVAKEPLAARYIRVADFIDDGLFSREEPSHHVPDVDRDRITSLFASSPYLVEAGLDWREYYALSEKDQQFFRYSQHAATFLLTLLPNVKNFSMPRFWKSTDKTEKLLRVVIQKARQSPSLASPPSLAQVTRLQSYSERQSELTKAIPFLALPLVRSYCDFCSVAVGETSSAALSFPMIPYHLYGETLRVAHFGSSFINEESIIAFLKHTTRLRTLTYSHRHSNPYKWDIGKFVAAVEREVGSHLEEFSVSASKLQRDTSTVGCVSMRGFHHLRKLEFPLSIVMHNMKNDLAQLANSNERSMDSKLGQSKVLIGDLVPPSVSHLVLTSSGTNYDAYLLEVMFRDFAATKSHQLPALREIYLSCPESPSADKKYKTECAKLVAETGAAGVLLKTWPYSTPMAKSIGQNVFSGVRDTH